MINIVKPKKFFELVKTEALNLSHLEKFAYIISSDNEKELDEFDISVAKIVDEIVLQKEIVVNHDEWVDFFKLVQEYGISISKYMDGLIRFSTILGIATSNGETYHTTTNRYTKGDMFIHLYANHKLSDTEKEILLEFHREQCYKKGMELKEQREKEELIKKSLEKSPIVEKYYDQRINIGDKNKFKGDVALGDGKIEK